MSEEPRRRPPWSEFKAALERVGFRPTKTRGQNFLLDENMIRSLVRDAGVRPGELVLEIGTGCGFLSAHLLEAGARLVTVEIDPRLAEVARGLLAGFEDWRLLETDVLASKHALAAEVVASLPDDEDWRLVANLPYSVSGPVLALVARLPNPPAAGTVLVQDELARRCAARAGEPEWGALAARLAPVFARRRGRTVRPELFWPRPRVESALLHLELLPGRPGPAELAALDRLVGGLFRYRRKTLRAAYRRFARAEGLPETLPATVPGLLPAPGGGTRALDPELRVEALDPEVLLGLAAGLRDNPGHLPLA